jgi:hypothetical protein
LLRRVVWYFTNVSEVLAASIIKAMMMMEALSTSKTLVNFYQTTRCNNPENSHLHTRRRENLKSHSFDWLFFDWYLVLFNDDV